MPFCFASDISRIEANRILVPNLLNASEVPRGTSLILGYFDHWLLCGYDDLWTATERPSSDRRLPLILHCYWFPSLWPSFNEVSTADGSELSLRSKATTCQISWSVSNLPQAGIPVLRIPCLTIQKSSPSLYPDGCAVNCGAGG